MPRHIAAATLTAAATAIAVTGCSSDTTTTLPKEQVEKRTAVELTKTVGHKPDDVKCPGDLKAEVGEKMTCVLTAGKSTVDVDVTVTSVKDDKTGLHIEVADHVN